MPKTKKTPTPTKAKPDAPAKEKPELSPIECKEHTDYILELEKQIHELDLRQISSHKIYKEDKEHYEGKRDELLKYLRGLNEEHPLFDDKNTLDIPWPFPLPDGTHEATLADVAADPIVLGLSVSVVKSVREKLSCSTLGQLEKWLKASDPLDAAGQAKGKQALGRELGPNQAQKVLRAIASFNGGRTKGKGKKPAKAAEPAPANETKAAPAEKAEAWRETKIADLETISLTASTLLSGQGLSTVGACLKVFQEITDKMPVGSPPDYLRGVFATKTGLADKTAGKVIDAVYEIEEHNLTKED